MSYNHLDKRLRRAIDFHIAVAAACVAKGGDAIHATRLAALIELRDRPSSEAAQATLDSLQAMQRSSLARHSRASQRRCTPQQVAEIMIRAERR